MKRSTSTCRNRPMRCEDCGYVVYGTRGWMIRGLPTCCCGGQILPSKPSDRAYIGLIGPEDVSQGAWNEIARENGWAIMLNQGQAVQAARRGRTIEPVLGAPSKPQCEYPGCGRWVKDGHEHCSEHSPVAAMPF